MILHEFTLCMYPLPTFTLKVIYAYWFALNYMLLIQVVVDKGKNSKKWFWTTLFCNFTTLFKIETKERLNFNK